MLAPTSMHTRPVLEPAVGSPRALPALSIASSPTALKLLPLALRTVFGRQARGKTLASLLDGGNLGRTHICT